MNYNSAFYLIDKPENFTSFDVLKILRSKLKVKRIWHTWTLDPLATGALLVATWKYTKLIPYFEKDSKEYEFSINFDWESDSYDLWTEVRYISDDLKEQAKINITKSKLEKVLLEQFTWEITQIPPKYSALKIWWRKALHMVKEWEDFEMKTRTCKIFEIQLLDFEYPKASVRAKVSAGTYIRSIASDLWKIFWTGAYISSLRRTKIWSLSVKDAFLFEKLKEEDSIDIKELFSQKEFIKLDESILEEINDWKRVKGDFDFKKNTELFVLNDKEVTNIVFYDWDILIPKKKF